jgi:opacity protein-like surface antigen
MRKFLILAATAATALVAATPAAAQWYPPQYDNGYGYNGYNGYGYNDYAGNLGYRINRLQQHINQFDSRNIISNREARSLRAQAYDLERQLRYGQGYNVERRLAQLEQRVDYIASRSYGRNYNRGWNGDHHNNWNGDRNWRDHDDRDDD